MQLNSILIIVKSKIDKIQMSCSFYINIYKKTQSTENALKIKLLTFQPWKGCEYYNEYFKTALQQQPKSINPSMKQGVMEK